MVHTRAIHAAQVSGANGGGAAGTRFRAMHEGAASLTLATNQNSFRFLCPLDSTHLHKKPQTTSAHPEANMGTLAMHQT
jgi:hypothetical protein